MKKTALALVLTVFVCLMAFGCGAKDTPSEVSSPTEEISTTESEAADPVDEPSKQNNSQESSDQVMAERLSQEATTNTIPEDLKKKVLEMPYADYQNLPSWHGTTLMNKVEYGWGPEGHPTDYSEALVDELAEVGFNFIRVTQDTRIYFLEETGTQVMLQEFGDCVYTEINGAQTYYDDMLSICDEDGFGWCQFGFDGGDFSLVALNDSYKRRGATYEKLSSGREICAELRDVLQKHMK